MDSDNLKLLGMLIPLAITVGGLLFWSGVLTQKVNDARSRIAVLEQSQQNDTVVAVSLGRLDQRMLTSEGLMSTLTREMAGVQRALAQMASRGAAGIHTFEQPNDNSQA